jgi:hypothetical protein
MSSTTRYSFDRVVQDTRQLDMFLLSHMGNPFIQSQTQGDVTYIYTSEQVTSQTTQDDIARQLDRYPDPPQAAAGPACSVITEVSSGGTGRNAIPAGSILFGADDEPLSTDSSLNFDPNTKTLGVISIT